MKKKHVIIHTDGFEGWKKRAAERARKLDRGEVPESEISITVDRDTLKALTTKRWELFRKVREQKATITDLAIALKRPREAVSRDVKLLTSVGLLKMKEVPNPGHGIATMVEPAADKILLEV